MTDAHRTLCLLAASALSICGCGGSPSTGKSYDHFVAAAKALETGDKETALTELSATLATTPSDWAYFERARLFAESGRDQEAAADVQKGLELAPQNANLKWLDAELKKPADNRFQGKFAQPPGLLKNPR
jgi:Tfp pilus assembly protein PilF